ncbi:hypothetical protein [Nocardia carnea]|nr:hypothetical protein [Nocardia carnea]
MQIVVRQTVLHRDGSSTPYRLIRVTALMLHTDHGWRLFSYRIT